MPGAGGVLKRPRLYRPATVAASVAAAGEVAAFLRIRAVPDTARKNCPERDRLVKLRPRSKSIGKNLHVKLQFQIL